MTNNPAVNPKQQVAEQAANMVENGMIVGLGTGSTANLFIDALAQRSRQEELQLRVVASSVISHNRAIKAGLSVLSINQLSGLDMYVDGADEVSDDLSLLKGRGQDLVKEKLLARHADQFVVLVDESKQVRQIGEKHPIPVEVAPDCWQLVQAALQQQGGQGSLRPNAAGDNVFYSADGNLVLDMTFTDITLKNLNQLLSTLPGVVEHGIFYLLASEVLIGKAQGVIRLTAD
ncbi:Ribose 5-phosphate isomerase A [Methylophaga frappieri]|uniref:Ribose-5-phosphate isomerase A n=1 Tax=Methylophaga frappieri (strain ATCC BAA-2434 / DSM 25690 / JAM7) TaxID=754477 RepID=I1YH59_METFJ|nr:ribose-5-phosphate isomerase RpiA [Methylophaga frappieri]AFJ02252.1 Ribose 5-phosphate isomerase A [Methylophaga frappieri]